MYCIVRVDDSGFRFSYNTTSDMEQREGGDIYIEDFIQEQGDASSSGLQQVFHESCVLLTGSTGFLGSLVLEKLLRSCDGVDKVYVTVRSKNEQTATQRLKHLFSTKLFDRVRLEHGEALNKVELIDLDRGLQNYASLLSSTVNMIIHCGLLMDGQHSLKTCVENNIKQTETVLDLAYTCRDLEAFVVVTSTLCHNHERVVEERFYPPPVTAKAMCNICDTINEDMYKNHTSGLIVNDTSASDVTLAILEDMLKKTRKSLPLAIVRPSMLIASYHEPLAGWVTSEPKGVMKLLTLTMQGRLSTLHCDPDNCAELMPADLAANFLLAVTAHVARTRRDWQNKEVEEPKEVGPGEITTDFDIPIFNLVSSNKSPLSWKEFFVCSLRHARNVPFLDTVWYPHLFLTKSKSWFSLWFYILHLVPAMAVDWWDSFTTESNILNAKRSRLGHKYRSIQECCRSLSYHSLGKQQFRDGNTRALWDTMSPGDRRVFNFTARQLDWDEYMYTLVRGVRLYCVADSLDTLPRAEIRINKLKLLHYASVVMASFAMLMVLRVFCKLFLF